MNSVVIRITRYIERYKHPYARPARYSSHTKYVLNINNTKQLKFGTGWARSYKDFVHKIKKHYGDNAEYEIDYSTPYVHYL